RTRKPDSWYRRPRRSRSLRFRGRRGTVARAMRHLKAHRKLGRTSEHRTSMLRNLATSLINSKDERIVTTLPKAKELRPFVERAITLSRQAQGLSNDDSKVRVLQLRRQAAGFFHAAN